MGLRGLSRPLLGMGTVLLLCCAGEATRPDAAKSATDTAGPALTETGVSPCSATGVATGCDPVGLGGCTGSACYVVKAQGPSCVCPPGSATTGASCSTTLECAPGHVCAGTQAPGICRKTCAPSASQCGANAKCTAITAFPSYGYCEPS